MCDHCLRSSNTTLRCSSCKKAQYCNSDCQKADWKAGHKIQCKKQSVIHLEKFLYYVWEFLMHSEGLFLVNWTFEGKEIIDGITYFFMSLIDPGQIEDQDIRTLFGQRERVVPKGFTHVPLDLLTIYEIYFAGKCETVVYSIGMVLEDIIKNKQKKLIFMGSPVSEVRRAVWDTGGKVPAMHCFESKSGRLSKPRNQWDCDVRDNTKHATLLLYLENDHVYSVDFSAMQYRITKGNTIIPFILQDPNEVVVTIDRLDDVKTPIFDDMWPHPSVLGFKMSHTTDFDNIRNLRVPKQDFRAAQAMHTIAYNLKHFLDQVGCI